MITPHLYSVPQDGSSLVPPMGANIDERMGEALDASSAVIMFVSKQYKESANCRMEAMYASQLARLGEVVITHVMMQETFTTNSRPDRVDGWLGFLVSGNIWYPLWTSNMMETAIDGVVSIIGDKGKKGVFTEVAVPDEKPEQVLVKSSPKEEANLSPSNLNVESELVQKLLLMLEEKSHTIEDLLKAENSQLKNENDVLRQAIEQQKKCVIC